MSDVGKTMLRGHALCDEGKLFYNAQGLFKWKAEHAKCQCGELSPPEITQAEAKRWHRAHKDSLR